MVLLMPLALLAAAAPMTLSYGPDPAQAVDVYVDDQDKSTSKPIAVFLHGGVWQHGDKRDNVNVGEALAHQGFVAVIASYRLTPTAVWPAQAEDAASIIDRALTEAPRFGGDSKKLVVIGHSAGAQLAAVLAYDPQFLAHKKRAPSDIKALALLSCVCDLTAPLDESQRDGGFAAFVAPTFGSDKQKLAAASPLRIMKKLAVPFLVVTSEHDYGAMRAQTLAMQKALTALGEDVRFIDVPAVDHFGIVASMGRKPQPQEGDLVVAGIKRLVAP